MQMMKCKPNYIVYNHLLIAFVASYQKLIVSALYLRGRNESDV